MFSKRVFLFSFLILFSTSIFGRYFYSNRIKTEIVTDWAGYFLYANTILPIKSGVPLEEKNRLEKQIEDEVLAKLSPYLENLVVDANFRLMDVLNSNNSFAFHYTSFLENIKNGLVYWKSDYVESRYTIPFRGRHGLLQNIPAPWKKENYEILQKLPDTGPAYEANENIGNFHTVSHYPTYTGLVIDCREFALQPAFLPRIYNQDGRLIYGPEFLSEEIGTLRGLVGYVQSYEDPEVLLRAGSKHYYTVPLMVMGKNLTDVVLSRSDEKKMLENKESAMNLKKGRVIFIISGKKSKEIF